MGVSYATRAIAAESCCCICTLSSDDVVVIVDVVGEMTGVTHMEVLRATLTPFETVCNCVFVAGGLSVIV